MRQWQQKGGRNESQAMQKDYQQRAMHGRSECRAILQRAAVLRPPMGEMGKDRQAMDGGGNPKDGALRVEGVGRPTPSLRPWRPESLAQLVGRPSG